jgi:hypothetical protein
MSLLKLNSIKIATFLLVTVFFYDIFFVFLTPFLTGGQSIMLMVAGGSGTEAHCYKYQEERSCLGVTFLPMLFILPRVNDYSNGSVILGLGDVILPGFLIAFCARYDAASRLVGPPFSPRFFFPMSIAYSTGLFLAFLAVILMKRGQPALLWICPVCLGTIFYLGRGDFMGLWNGAEVLDLADRLIMRSERAWDRARTRRLREEKRQEDSMLDVSQNRPKDESSNRISSVVSPDRNCSIADIGDSDCPEGGDALCEHVAGDIAATNAKSRCLPHPNTCNRQLSRTTTPDLPVISTPTSNDVCFGDEDHPGTKVFRKVVKEIATELDGEEYSPNVHKSIKVKLNGKRFFKTGTPENWILANKYEIRDEIGKAYDLCRGRTSKFFSKSSSS